MPEEREEPSEESNMILLNMVKGLTYFECVHKTFEASCMRKVNGVLKMTLADEGAAEEINAAFEEYAAEKMAEMQA